MQHLKVINQAIKFIEDNLYEPITVLDVAKSASYSYYHFHRFFYLTMNETIGNYIRSRRLTQAAYDLVHSKRSIISIGLSLGFQTPESFTRAFKKRYLMTPSAYRKQGLDILIGNKPSLQNVELRVSYRVEPDIVNLPAATIVGKRFSASQIKDGYVDVWRLFNKEFRQDFPKSDLCGIFELNKSFPNPNTFNLESESGVFIGADRSPKGLVSEKYDTKILEGGKYAKFTYIGAIDNLLQFYIYIWGEWSINSKYELDNREDFELYTERFIGEDDIRSEIDIYVPIK